MTKEEYEKLLQSDYWKGYSYSLIKERNFTCEDCGRQFPNERNKLQVHHLVYRDANPWSYKPEELIVLCEDCHRKRHGFYSEPVNENPNYSVSSEVNPNNYHYENNPNSILGDENQSRWPKEKPFKVKYVLFLFLLFVAFMIGLDKYQKSNRTEEKTVEMVETQKDTEDTTSDKQSSKTVLKSKGTAKQKDTNNRVKEQTTSPKQLEQAKTQPTPQSVPGVDVKDRILEKKETITQSQPTEKKEELSTSEILDRRQHARVVQQAKEAGVSTEGSTMEILDRMQHARVVQQAKEAGVSTEGSTMEILDRMQHARVVQQAKEAGVSTEGSTMEILDRMQHARVVQQAKEAGVSTEGSTMEILDRIMRKKLQE